MKTRTEKDAMGSVTIPSHKLYGASTQRALENFTISQRTFDTSFITALGLIKWACARANHKLKTIDPKIANAIEKAALEIAQGQHSEHFVLDIFQTGSGTSTNMNANEVIANLCKKNSREKSKYIHPNDHVNLGQSSNDVIPSTIHVAASLAIQKKLLPSLSQLEQSLKSKEKAFKNIIKPGRTHLNDATPVTLGQEFSGYKEQITANVKRIKTALPGLHELAIGGTAVGTGINTHPKFAKEVCKNLSQITGIPFKEATNHFEAQAAKDACVFLSAALKTLAVSLFKISNDIRWLASGPRCGLSEIQLPELQPGSSIMPGKVNPVICEAVMQVCVQVQGNDLVVQLAGQNGNFELNTMMPVLASNLLESIEILTNATLLLAQKCIDGIAPHQKRCDELVKKNLSLATKLNPILGYDRVAELVKKALKNDITLHDLLTQEQILTPDQIQKHLDPRTMLKPSKK